MVKLWVTRLGCKMLKTRNGSYLVMAMAIILLLGFGYWYSDRFGFDEEKAIHLELESILESLSYPIDAKLIGKPTVIMKPNLVVIRRGYAVLSKQDTVAFFDKQFLSRGFLPVKVNVTSDMFTNGIENQFGLPRKMVYQIIFKNKIRIKKIFLFNKIMTETEKDIYIYD